MDRFPETTFTYGNLDLDEDGCLSYPEGEELDSDEQDDPDQPSLSVALVGRIQDAVSSAVLVCHNCIQTAERLTASPLYEDDFMICDTCMEETIVAAEVRAAAWVERKRMATARMLAAVNEGVA